jgi:hypothetical protein
MSVEQRGLQEQSPEIFRLSVLLGAALIVILFLLFSSAHPQNESLLPGVEQNNKEQNIIKAPSSTSNLRPGTMSRELPSTEPIPEEIKKRKEETERGPGREPPFPRVEPPEPPTPHSQTTVPQKTP